MKIPQGRRLVPFLEDIIDQCMYSQKSRMDMATTQKQYFYYGSSDGSQAIYNRCFPHIDRLASYLFSPAEVHFVITQDPVDREAIPRLKIAGKHLSYEFHRTGSDIQFSHAVDWALCKGSSFVKTLWSGDGLEATVVQPETMGVYREDINGLDRQEAFNHQIFITKGQLAAMVDDHPEKDEILKKALASQDSEARAVLDQTLFHQMTIGYDRPLTSGSAGKRANVSVFSGNTPEISPQVHDGIILMNETWIWDDEREDWTTFQTIGRNLVVEGKLIHRNLTGIKGEHPFTQVCCNHTEGYFWGISELSGLISLQDCLSSRMAEVDRIARLRSKPPRFITGTTGISDQEKTALATPGGFVISPSPNAKTESMAPELPPELFEQINMTINYFDDIGGFEAITKGQGEAGVRSGVHAETLVRTATPRLRDKSLQIERQCADMGDLCLKILRKKSTRPFILKDGAFLLDQLPDDVKVNVDSHTSSPAFSQENRALAMDLLKSGAITPKQFISLTHPPTEDILVEEAEMREEAEQKVRASIMEKAKKDPSLLEKISSKIFGKGVR